MQVGSDIGLHVGKNFIDAFPERVVKSHLIPLLNEANRLGEKSGAGFYKYESRKPTKDAALAGLLEQSRQAAGLQEVRWSWPYCDAAAAYRPLNAHEPGSCTGHLALRAGE
jgi:3-hydroxyacyl-CoA dehydrogenase